MTDDPSELSKQQDRDRRKLNRDYLEVRRLRKLVDRLEQALSTTETARTDRPS